MEGKVNRRAGKGGGRKDHPRSMVTHRRQKRRECDSRKTGLAIRERGTIHTSDGGGGVEFLERRSMKKEYK